MAVLTEALALLSACVIFVSLQLLNVLSPEAVLIGCVIAPAMALLVYAVPGEPPVWQRLLWWRLMIQVRARSRTCR